MQKIKVSIRAQELLFIQTGSAMHRYRVSTSFKGVGQESGSGKTPIGMHIVRAKIGGGLPINTVFKGRRPTGEVFTKSMLHQHPQRDWILSRILWLSGTQPGINRWASVDTMARYIYIHGTPYETELGNPVSHGCIRMGNKDVIELFDSVQPGCKVEITNG